MVRLRFASLALALFWLATSQGMAQTNTDKPTTAELVEILETSESDFERAMACRQLAHFGDASAVTALANAAQNERLSAYARNALEQIEGSDATDALNDLATSLEGDLQLGALSSIGRRGDQSSIAILLGLIESDSVGIQIAAARALSEFEQPEAFHAILSALENQTGSNADQFANAALASAHKLESVTNASDAIARYQALQSSAPSDFIRYAAEYRSLVLAGPDGIDRIAELLSDEQEDAFSCGLQVAIDLGPDAVPAIIRIYQQLDDGRREVVIPLVAQSQSSAAIEILKSAITSDEASIQIAALNSLTDELVSDLAVDLINLTQSDQEALAHAALVSLNRVDGDQLEQQIVDLLNVPDLGSNLAAIKLIETRGMTGTAEKLTELTTSNDARLQSAAIKALGSCIELNELPSLISRMLNSNEALQPNWRSAVSTACARLPRESSAELLTDALDDADTSGKIVLLEELRQLGGTTALETVVRTAESNDDTLQDNATRLLGEWPTSDVAPHLRRLAVSLDSSKYRIRAMRGYVRAARQLEMSTGDRTDICYDVLEIAERHQELALLPEVIRRFPTPRGMHLVVQLLNEDEVRQPARNVLLNSYRGMLEQNANEVTELLRLAEKFDDELSGLQPFRVAYNEAIAKRETDEQSAGFGLLFDGKSFDGWHGNLDWFRIEDEAIVAGTLERDIPQNEFLRTDQEYRDFELRLQFKLVGESPNAGVQIRTQEIPDHHEVSGYQADLGPGWFGCLYDESRRRRVLAGPPSEARSVPVIENDWNDYRIVCKDERIQLFINGVQTVDFVEEDDDIPLSGIIAVQVHSGRPMEAWYRNIRLRDLSE